MKFLSDLLSKFRGEPVEKPCKHKANTITFPLAIGEFSIHKTELLGVTLSWGGRPAPLMRAHVNCHLCGEDFIRDQTPIRNLWRDKYPVNDEGWPTHNGKPLPVHQGAERD